MMQEIRNWPRGWKRGLLKDYLASLRFPQKNKVFEDVQAFCCFLGHSRSGHSLLASILDAHRHVVLADELHSMRYAALPFTQNQIFRLILGNSRYVSSFSRERAGYQFEIPNEWQGAFERISVIGDKDGSFLADMATRNITTVKSLCAKFGQSMRVLHIYRNPFDVISTIQKRHVQDFGQQPLEKAIDYVFKRQKGIEIIRNIEGLKVLDVCYEDFLGDTESELRRICQFLSIDCPNEYIDSCRSIMFSNANKSRFEVNWSQDQIADVLSRMSRYDYLNDYTFQ